MSKKWFFLVLNLELGRGDPDGVAIAEQGGQIAAGSSLNWPGGGLHRPGGQSNRSGSHGDRRGRHVDDRRGGAGLRGGEGRVDRGRDLGLKGGQDLGNQGGLVNGGRGGGGGRLGAEGSAALAGPGGRGGGGELAGRGGSRGTTGSGADSSNPWGSGDNLDEALLLVRGLGEAFGAGLIGDGDQGTLRVHIAVAAGQLVPVPGLLLGDVGLLLAIGHLELEVVLGAGGGLLVDPAGSKLLLKCRLLGGSGLGSGRGRLGGSRGGGGEGGRRGLASTDTAFNQSTTASGEGGGGGGGLQGAEGVGHGQGNGGLEGGHHIVHQGVLVDIVVADHGGDGSLHPGQVQLGSSNSQTGDTQGYQHLEVRDDRVSKHVANTWSLRGARRGVNHRQSG